MRFAVGGNVRSALVLGAVSGSFALAACGGGGDSDDSGDKPAGGTTPGAAPASAGPGAQVRTREILDCLKKDLTASEFGPKGAAKSSIAIEGYAAVIYVYDSPQAAGQDKDAIAAAVQDAPGEEVVVVKDTVVNFDRSADPENYSKNRATVERCIG